MIEFVDGVISPAARSVVEAHLAACWACNELVTEAAAALREGTRPLARSAGLLPADSRPAPGSGAIKSSIAWDGAAWARSTRPITPTSIAVSRSRWCTSRAWRSADRQARLLREARAIARLSHPNVVAVYDAGTVADRVYVAMEFVEGLTIDRWLAAARRTWREILRVFVAAGRGLSAAHAAGLVHRDFKPQNVMIARDGSVRVMDFGLARLTAAESASSAPAATTPPPSDGQPATALSTVTQAGTVVGTPAYMSPEQFRGDPADARSDQFSFCVALYEALYGVRPFRGEHLLSLTMSVTEGELRPAEDAAKHAVPVWIRRAITRGLRRDPADRFPSMQALIDRLEDDPAVRRRRPLGGGAVVAVVVATILVAWQTTSRRRAAAEREIARHLDEATRAASEARTAAAEARTLRAERVRGVRSARPAERRASLAAGAGPPPARRRELRPRGTKPRNGVHARFVARTTPQRTGGPSLSNTCCSPRTSGSATRRSCWRSAWRPWIPTAAGARRSPRRGRWSCTPNRPLHASFSSVTNETRRPGEEPRGRWARSTRPVRRPASPPVPIASCSMVPGSRTSSIHSRSSGANAPSPTSPCRPRPPSRPGSPTSPRERSGSATPTSSSGRSSSDAVPIHQRTDGRLPDRPPRDDVPRLDRLPGRSAAGGTSAPHARDHGHASRCSSPATGSRRLANRDATRLAALRSEAARADQLRGPKPAHRARTGCGFRSAASRSTTWRGTSLGCGRAAACPAPALLRGRMGARRARRGRPPVSPRRRAGRRRRQHRLTYERDRRRLRTGRNRRTSRFAQPVRGGRSRRQHHGDGRFRPRSRAASSIRGGGYYFSPASARSSNREQIPRSVRDVAIGLRVCADAAIK